MISCGRLHHLGVLEPCNLRGALEVELAVNRYNCRYRAFLMVDEERLADLCLIASQLLRGMVPEIVVLSVGVFAKLVSANVLSLELLPGTASDLL